MKRGIILIFTAIVILYGCLSDKELSNISVVNQKPDIINATTSQFIITSGDEAWINVYAKKDISAVSFNLKYDKSLLDFIRIERKGYSEDYIISTIDSENGVNMLFADMKNNLQKDKEFAKIVFKTRKKVEGNVDFTIENIIGQ